MILEEALKRIREFPEMGIKRKNWNIKQTISFKEKSDKDLIVGDLFTNDWEIIFCSVDLT